MTFGRQFEVFQDPANRFAMNGTEFNLESANINLGGKDAVLDVKLVAKLDSNKKCKHRM